MSDPGFRDPRQRSDRRACARSHSRAHRASVKAPASSSRAKSANAPRRRRGFAGKLQSAWRRLSLGTNHIVNYGLWRPGTRRAALRANRSGDTRWHRPYTELTARVILAGRSS